MNHPVSDRLRSLAQDIFLHYAQPSVPDRDEFRRWSDRLQAIAREVEQNEWDRYDAIIARDMEMG